MARLIESHGFLADGRCGALVASDGVVDWMCAPRFDSPPFFAALLGSDENGVWRLGPAAASRLCERRYAGRGLVLETLFACEGGALRLVDFMARGSAYPRLVRIVEGVSGSVPVLSEIVMRPDFGSFVPRCQPLSMAAAHCYGGGDAAVIHASVPLIVTDEVVHARFALRGGERAWFTLTWHAPSEPPPASIDPDRARRELDVEEERWVGKLTLPGFGAETAARSAIVLRNLTYAPTGAICAAPTTSLPERPGGSLNWDYRFSWIRDTSFALWAFLEVGAIAEASAAVDWLLRTSAGRPQSIQAAYTLDGYRRVRETVVDELPGYLGSRPVRDGNAAATQVQLDVFGEILLSAMRLEEAGHPLDSERWRLVGSIADALEDLWRRPGHGFWEVRGRTERYLTDRTLTCVGLRAMARGAKRRGETRRIDRYELVAQDAEDEIRRDFVDARRATLVATARSKQLGATALWPILMGIVRPDDPLATETINAIQRRLVRGGLVYRTESDLSPHDIARTGEGAFLPCTGWLARCQAICGRGEEARITFERLLAAANDLGLFSEEYDPIRRRMLGNVPQAFTHAETILAAKALSKAPA